MLFYTSDEKDLELIPSSYNVIALTQSHLTNNNCKYVRLDNSLIPNINGSLSKDEKKDAYKIKLQELKALVAYIAKDTFGHQAESIVLYCNDKDIERYGFNYVKAICKFMNKRYGIKPFKFVTTVTKDMRLDAQIDEASKYKILKDCQIIHNLIVDRSKQ